MDHWVEWLENLDYTNVWQASKFISMPPTDAARMHVPTLQIKGAMGKVIKEAVTNTDKGKMLHDIFFLTANPDLGTIPADHQYPPPRWKFTNITDNQIHRAINKLKPYKATR